MRKLFGMLLFLIIICSLGWVLLPKPGPTGVHWSNLKSRPNVVLIQIDTLRADMLGCYGCKWDTSPALDKLAYQGVRFKQVLASASWTRPSMGALVTSQYPRTLGIYRLDNQALPTQFDTLSETLQNQGYTTLGLTANPQLNILFNFNQGFDCYRDSHHPYRQKNPEPIQAPGQKPALHDAPRLFNDAWKMLEDYEKDKPVYLQMVIIEPHEWYTKSEDPRRLIRTPYDTMFESHPYATYLQSVRQVTDDLGKFIEQLKKRPGWKDTLFIILSDHGEGLGDHPDVYTSNYHGYVLYESNVMVPWILYREGWRPPRQRIAQTVRLLDVMPTVLDLLNLNTPEDLVGISLAPVLLNKQAEVTLPEYMFTESHLHGMKKKAAYGPKWKYIRVLKEHTGTAPHELQRRGLGNENGANSSYYDRYPETAQVLQQQLRTWEENFPEAPPTPCPEAVTEELKQQLEAMGYFN